MSALQAGVMGMLAHQLRMDAVGNNIANANTVGYKGLRVLFTDALYQVIAPATAPTARFGGTNPSSIGQGVQVGGVDTQFRQGDLMATGRSTDVAIEGEGFLAVTDGDRVFYTRNGALALDADGNLVHLASGLRVVGLPPAAPGGASGVPSPAVSAASTLRIPLGQATLASATSQVRLGGNLDSRAAAGSAYTVSSRVYDSLGAGHDVTLTFTRSASGNRWDVSGSSPDGAVTVGAPTQVTFDDKGTATVRTLPLQLALTDPKGAAAQLGMTLSLDGMKGVAQESSAALVAQDGAAPGSLVGISINPDGSISGAYSNGLIGPLGQLVTASFANPGGLENAKNGLYSVSANSGAAVYGNPGSGGRGAMRSGQLEASNVNLAQEFADMIVTQRGFQASSRVITTADQMLQELMNITR